MFPTMSETGTSEGTSVENEKPVQAIEDMQFPPFPDPSDKDFDDDLSEEEKSFYKNKFPDINEVINLKLHCTACDRHLGCSARSESRMRPHPMLRTLICHTCHSFYNSGEFDKGEDGSELYCRWCGQGGQVYCCSDCVHVFCAKCIKRNFGVAKIKEIENTDDWKCFKCNPRCLWDLRAVCWALLRFCDIRNKIVFHTEDPVLKEKYQKAITIDLSECCRNKGKRKEKTDSAKKKEREVDTKKTLTKILPKLPPTIQVKKFASINLDESPKIEKKAQKRSASPKQKISPGYIQKPISIAPCTVSTPIVKKIRLPSASLLNPVRFGPEKKMTNSFTRIASKPRQPYPIPIVNTTYNGINNSYSINMPSLIGDNINLSLETLTQGLDMTAVAAFNNAPSQATDSNDVVCTPDFPLEPLCEVTEENDDDVECITPGPVVVPKVNNPPPLVPRSLHNISSDNIVQMTENDVTVNTVTGGLKFRVDPQTLSSNKMYRLPDGRIFAINPNPNMPGGYSATIVSVSDAGGKTATKGGETFAAKLSAVTASPTPSGSNSRNTNIHKAKAKSTPKPKVQKRVETPKENRECDLRVPVEWFRYNLIDAVDALDYSLSRLNKLKKEATTAHLRTRTVDEIKYLHRTLEQLLTTSSKRFLEVRDSLNKELKQYIARKSQNTSGEITEDDDDVEFLPNTGNDDPIFIDENSLESVNINENQEVDLTGAGSSEHNNSAENKDESDPLYRLLCHEEDNFADKDSTNLNNSTLQAESILPDELTTNSDKDEASNDKNESNHTDKKNAQSDEKPASNSDSKDDNGDTMDDKQPALEDKPETKSNKEDEKSEQSNQQDVNSNDKTSDTEDSCRSSNEIISDKKPDEINGENGEDEHKEIESMDVDIDKRNVFKEKADPEDEQTQDTDISMSEEAIDTLLKDTDMLDGIDNVTNTDSSLHVQKELRDDS